MNAQDLKNSILQLAIQGKLVEQRKEEGTAKELLEQIKAEKEQLIKEGKLKREKPLPEITEDEIPFDIPESWEWTRVFNVADMYTGNSIAESVKLSKYTKVEKGYDYIATKDVGFDHVVDYENGVRIPFNEDKFRYSYQNSILMCIEGGSAGRKIGILDRTVCFGNKLCSFNAIIIDPLYLYYYLQSPLFTQVFRGGITGIIGGVSINKLKTIIIPLPPLEEQKRIVAKIEELMPYVEKYGEAHSKLEEFNKKFPEDMQKSILQYAIQGKLVEQREEEGTAEELYRQIQAEKAKLIKEGKIKKEKPLAEIAEDEIPFEIPENWKWVRLGDLVSFCGGFAYKSTSYISESNNQIIRLGNVKNDKILLETNPVFISDELAENTNKYKIIAGDILFTMTGTRGKKDYFYTTVVSEEVLKIKKLYLNQRVGCLRNWYNINMHWLSLFLKADCITSQIFATETGTANQGNIGSDNTMAMLIPLPPLEEQKRIVAKIEEMLPFCQQLVK